MPCIEEKSPIISALTSLNCCQRCIVRYLCYNDLEDSSEPYLHPEKFISEEDVSIAKKPKPGVCLACLGIFEDATLDKITSSLSLKEADQYKEKTFTTFISLPKAVLVRDYSMILFLKGSFPDVYKNVNLEDHKKVLKIISTNTIVKTIDKTFHSGSDLKLLVDILYEDDEEEIKNLMKISDKVASRANINEILEKCDDTAFKKYFSVPPKVPDKEIKVKTSFIAETIYLGGRYLKFSRDMGQTPWVINSKVMAEYCLSDIIFDSVSKILGYNKSQMTFCASGREDADVRMLGNGRPFYIQITNPKNTTITFEDCFRIEEDIISTKLTAVIGLQKVKPSDVKVIKTGEEHKRKHYYALCHTTALDTNEVVKKLNEHSCPFNLHQKTPLRVLHRRAQSIRDKVIHEMSAKVIEGRDGLFYLKVVTSAGTYVKEFVHGDFERTLPNVGSITGYSADILALDVTKVELDWPL